MKWCVYCRWKLQNVMIEKWLQTLNFCRKNVTSFNILKAFSTSRVASTLFIVTVLSKSLNIGMVMKIKAFKFAYNRSNECDNRLIATTAYGLLPSIAKVLRKWCVYIITQFTFVSEVKQSIWECYGEVEVFAYAWISTNVRVPSCASKKLHFTHIRRVGMCLHTPLSLYFLACLLNINA